MPRQKGSKNKVTLVMRDLITTILNDGQDKFQKELNSLTGRPYVDAYIKLIEFITPKAKDQEDIKQTEELIIKVCN